MKSKNLQKRKQDKRKLRAHRVRARIGTALPRLSVFRSARHIFAQVIDDRMQRTIAAASDKDVKAKVRPQEGLGAKAATAWAVGHELASRAQGKGIKKVVFDRGRYAYHGRVKAVADGARDGGLEF